MRQGEKSVFTIAPEYAYGAEGLRGSVPPNATLYFEVELLCVSLRHMHPPSKLYTHFLTTCTSLFDMVQLNYAAPPSALS